MKTCSKCGIEKPLDEFYKDKGSKDGKYCWCKPCAKASSRAYYGENTKTVKARTSAYLKEYRKANLEKFRAYQMKRIAAQLDRTPVFADLQVINDFYQNCPPGHEVDHIIPLQGKTVSGLHISSNLQYLPANKNKQKGNTFTPTLMVM